MSKFLIGLGVLLVIFYFGVIYYPTNCLLVGANICYFTEVERLLSGDEPDRVEQMIELCSRMNESPKKNKCFYQIASVADAAKLDEVCSYVVDNGRYTEAKCLRRKW